jgi:hypothetical protein
MDVTPPCDPAGGWLLLVFSLPARSASQRVEIWRRLRRSGVLALKSSGYLLPRTAVNEERLQWLAAGIRKHRGEASVLQVTSFDNLGPEELTRLFNAARDEEYAALARELEKLAKRKSAPDGAVSRLRRRFQEVAERDFFHAPARRRVERVLFSLEATGHDRPRKSGTARGQYAGRTWITRPRPGIDRVSSAWLIRRFIDGNATFVFGSAPDSVRGAVPFDMFGGDGFSHRGEDCTFETLVKAFSIRDTRVRRIAQAVHDADLGDDKFGRTEALGLDQALAGWATQGISDDELLRRGMELIEGLYHFSAPAA